MNWATLAAHIVFRAKPRSIRTIAVAMNRHGDLCKLLSSEDAVQWEGVVFSYVGHVPVLYYSDSPPSGLTGADVVVVGPLATIENAAAVRPNLWIVACVGRMAIKDMGTCSPP